MNSGGNPTQAFSDITSEDTETLMENDVAEDTVPATGKAQEPVASKDDKRVADTLAAAQREFHELAKLKREYESLISGAKIKTPEPEPLRVEFGKDFADALLESPENASRMLTEKVNKTLEALEVQNRSLLYQIAELRNGASIEDPDERQAKKEVDELPYAQYLNPEEKLDLIKRFAEKAKAAKSSGGKDQVPPGGMGSSHRPARSKEPKKPVLPDAVFVASGAKRDLSKRANIW